MTGKRKNRGWENEPVRHSLASKGVETSAGSRASTKPEDLSRIYKNYSDKLENPKQFQEFINQPEILNKLDFKESVKVDDVEFVEREVKSKSSVPSNSKETIVIFDGSIQIGRDKWEDGKFLFGLSVGKTYSDEGIHNISLVDFDHVSERYLKNYGLERYMEES